MTTQSTPQTISIDKEALFGALVRIFLLMESADPFGDVLHKDNERRKAFLAAIDQNDVPVPPDDLWVNPPMLFDRLFDSLYNFSARFTGEHVGLFALLSTPIVENPELKKEFEEYTLHKHGFIIPFEVEVSEKSTKAKPHLSVVRPETTPDKDPPSS